MHALAAGKKADEKTHEIDTCASSHQGEGAGGYRWRHVFFPTRQTSQIFTRASPSSRVVV